jgi:hypothetical protein
MTWAFAVHHLGYNLISAMTTYSTTMSHSNSSKISTFFMIVVADTPEALDNFLNEING